MPYLLHPDKVAVIDELVQREAERQKKALAQAADKAPMLDAPAPVGVTAVDALAQNLFMERQRKQRGLA